MYFSHDRVLEDALCKLLLLDEHICITKHLLHACAPTKTLLQSRYSWITKLFKTTIAGQETVEALT